MKRQLYLTFVLTFYILTGLQAQIDWVGNRFPDTGTTVSGTDFTVYVQVYKAGVTEAGGEGPGIDCEIYYGEVTAFGLAWSTISSFPMTYNVDIGNNDEYSGNMNLGVGLYEYVCRCTDDGGVSWFYDTDGFNGQLTVDAATPVTLSYFNGNFRDDNVLLEWATESEDNNSHFEIEKSTDGRNWVLHEIVEGSGSTLARKTYSLIDSKPLMGMNYYRLKQVDFDGKFEYSPIVNVEVKETAISIYPNPVVDRLTVNLGSELSGDLLVFDVRGQVVDQLVVEKQELLEVDFSEWMKGVYFVQFTNRDGQLIVGELIVK